jgi:flavin-dependent dehydrogenase
VDIVQADSDANRVRLTSRDGRVFEAPIVIAADGVHSVIARRLGLNPGWPADAVALDMMEETPRAELRDLDPSTLWVAYGYEGIVGDPNKERQTGPRNSRACVPKGYAYIFPKLHHVNIGVGYVLSYYRTQIDDAPYDLQRRFVETLESRGVVSGHSVRENFTPFLIPVGGPLRRPGAGRVLLAGDAGGFVNAFTAEGIYYAMVSGDLAAKSVVETSQNPGELAERYRRACDYEIGTELRDSVLIQRYLFSDRHRIAEIVAGAHREPAITRFILDLAMGRRSYREVRRRVLLRAPFAAGRFAWELVKSAAAL